MFLKSVNIIYVLCYFYEAREPFKKSLDIIMHCGGIFSTDIIEGHFQFRGFQLNKIIGFSLGALWENIYFHSQHTFIWIPPNFYTLLNNMQ